MFKSLIEKELKNIIQSPKFVAVFITCSILILLSIGIGISEYFNSANQYNTAQDLNISEMKNARSWMTMRSKAFRQPDPMQIFSAGVNYDIGRYSAVDKREDVKLQHSIYSDDPIFAVFQFMDFTFIVTVVFSLFAILFTYNSISGEKEGGTLRLLFSNSIPRAKFIAAKFIGSWLGLVVPLLVPILIGLLLVVIFKVPLTSAHWLKIVMLLLTSILYTTFFIALGIFISALTKYSNVSFLVLLVLWITFIFIIPRIGVMTASQFVNVPTIAELESKKDAYSKAQWDKHYSEYSKVWEKRNSEMENLSEAEKESLAEEKEYQWFEEDNNARTGVEKNIADYSLRIKEEAVNKKSVLENLALNFSRISPSSSYQLATMNISGTNIDLKNRSENSIQDYKTGFTEFTDKKQAESDPNAGMFMFTFDSEKGMTVKMGRQESSLDISELPKYVDTAYSMSASLGVIITDIGLLFLYILISYAGAFVAFLKYDLR